MMLKHFWALPAVLRVAVCAQQSFNVHNDILAYPQYEVVFPPSYIPAEDAAEALAPQTSDSHEQAEDGSQDISNGRQYGASDEDFPEYDVPVRFERMMLRRRPYLCMIPDPPPEAPVNTTATTQEEQQQELMRASDHGWELLKNMEGNCIYYGAGWWVYAFCYNENIKQFHPLPPGRGVPIYPPSEDKSVNSYVLGRFENQQSDRGSKSSVSDTKPEPSKSIDQESSAGETGKTDLDIAPSSSRLQTRGETNYLVQKLGGGTVCDLTGSERRVEVQFHCNPNSPDRIHMIKETASCVYLMVIHTPRLCNDVAFLPPQTDKPTEITCEEIVEENKESEWRAIRAAEEASNLVQTQAEAVAAQKQKPVIGGIEVGGHKLVGGSPDRMIKPSEIVQRMQEAIEAHQRGESPDKEQFIATLAKSDGKYTSTLSEKEMKKKGLKGGKKEAERLIQEMHDWAGEGMPWRLDIVKTEDGLQFRGTSESSEAEKSDDEKDEKAAREEGEESKKKKKRKTDDDSDSGSQEEFKNKKQP